MQETFFEKIRVTAVLVVVKSCSYCNSPMLWEHRLPTEPPASYFAFNLQKNCSKEGKKKNKPKKEWI